MSGRFWSSLAVGLCFPSLFACKNGDGDTASDHPHETGFYSPPDDVPEELLFTEVFAVPERAWDLSWSPDGIVFCSAQSGGKLYSWDPIAEDRDEETDDLGGLRALAFDGSDLYLTLSNQGVTGSLARRDGRSAEVLFTRADDGTLFRDPVDLISDGSGGWILADYKAPGLFWVSVDGSVVFLDSGSMAPNGLALEDDWLWIGGDDGIWRMAWPGGVPESIDARAANALLVVEDMIWAASSADDLFVVGGETLGGSELARPGSMAAAPDGSIYVADRVGEDVWSVGWE